MATTADRASRRSASTRARAAATAAPASVPDIIENDDLEVVEETPEEIASRLTTQAVNKSSGKKFGSSKGLALPVADLTKQLDPSDVIMPKLRLSQQMSEVNKEFTKTRGKAGVAAGNWYLSTQKKDLGASVLFVPVDMSKSRAMFLSGKGVICRSFDLLHGEGSPGGLCEGTIDEMHEEAPEDRGCPLRLWEKDADGNNRPPKCGITFNYPGFIITTPEGADPDDMNAAKFSVCLLQLRSSNTAAAKAINSAVMDAGEGVWHNTIIDMGVTEKSNRFGEFYIATAEHYETISKDADPDGDFEKVLRYGTNMARTVTAASVRRSAEAGGED